MIAVFLIITNIFIIDDPDLFPAPKEYTTTVRLYQSSLEECYNQVDNIKNVYDSESERLKLLWGNKLKTRAFVAECVEQ